MDFLIYLIIAIFDFIILNLHNRNEKRIEKLQEEFQKQIQNIKDKILPFETESSQFYKKYLHNFFEKNLYKKRSGTEQFEHSLSKFSQMIDEVE